MKTNTLSELSEMITETVRAYPDNRKLMSALRAIQWRLVTADGEYIQRMFSPCLLGRQETAVVFDGRDNEVKNMRWFTTQAGKPLFVEIIPQIS